MKSQPGASVFRSIGWNSLAGILILLPFPTATAGDGLSLDPNPLRACETLTVRWPSIAVPFFIVNVVDDSVQTGDQALFQTTVYPPFSPTISVEWPASATKGASLHLAVQIPPNPSVQYYLAADFEVHSGSTTCAPSASTTTPPNSITTTSTILIRTNPTSSSTGTPSPTAPLTSLPSMVNPTVLPSLTLLTTGATAESSTSTSDLQTRTSWDASNSGPSASVNIPSSAHANPLAALPPHTSSSPPPSISHSPSRGLSSGAITGVVVGLLAGGALVVTLALYLLRRRVRRSLPAAQKSSFPSHIGWLPRTSYRAELSLCSDSHLSDVDSERPIAAWNPRLFVRERGGMPPDVGYAESPSRSPLVQHPSLPSGIATVTVPSTEVEGSRLDEGRPVSASSTR